MYKDSEHLNHAANSCRVCLMIIRSEAVITFGHGTAPIELAPQATAQTLQTGLLRAKTYQDGIGSVIYRTIDQTLIQTSPEPNTISESANH